MKELKIKLINIQKLAPTLLIDGKARKFKKNQFGSYEINHQTEKDKVEIVIRRYLELSGALWLVWSILYFIISAFGIFDCRLDFKCIVINCKFIIPLKNDVTKVNFSFNEMNNEGQAVNIESETPIETISNNYFIDKKVQKRTKIIFILRILLSCALIATISYFIIKKYI